MNSAKQAGSYQHANVTSKRLSNGTRIFWNSNIDSLNLKPEPPKQTDSSYPNTERNTESKYTEENGTDHNTGNTPRTETDGTDNTKFVNDLVHLDDDGSAASKTNQYMDNTDLIDDRSHHHSIRTQP